MREPRRCCAVGCTVEVPTRVWMCARHWGMVPDAIRERHDDLNARRLRVENPGRTYICTQAAAIWAVAQQEGTDAGTSPMVHLARRLRHGTSSGGEVAA